MQPTNICWEMKFEYKKKAKHQFQRLGVGIYLTLIKVTIKKERSPLLLFVVSIEGAGWTTKVNPFK